MAVSTTPGAGRASGTGPVQYGSYLVAFALCALSLWQGLLPGILGVGLGFMFVSQLRQAPLSVRPSPAVAAGLVILVPVLSLVLLGLNAKGLSLMALSQYKELLEHMSTTVLDIRQKLPPDLAKLLPEGSSAAQHWLAEHLRSQAGLVAQAGKSSLHGALLAFVGLIVGSLMAVAPRTKRAGPLTLELRDRAAHFYEAFRQIVTAQVWIAGFNAVLTAVFLLGVLPLFDVSMPYTGALVGLTFLAGLVPIVGNLLCNVILTLVGVSVSPMVGLSCLLFLIAIHKFEYFINAKVVGSKTSTSVWELLAVMFAAEAVLGVVGLVAGPLYYAYLKKELASAKLI